MGDYYLKINLNNLSEKMMVLWQSYIQFHNKYEKREKEKKIVRKIELNKEIIKYISPNLKKSKSLVCKVLRMENLYFN